MSDYGLQSWDDEPAWATPVWDGEAAGGATFGAAGETAAGREDREASERAAADAAWRAWDAATPTCQFCDLHLLDSVTHEDGTPRCVQWPGQVAALLDRVDSGLAWVERHAKRSKPQPRPQRRTGGGGRPPAPPKFKRFGVF